MVEVVLESIHVNVMNLQTLEKRLPLRTTRTRIISKRPSARKIVVPSHTNLLLECHGVYDSKLFPTNKLLDIERMDLRQLRVLKDDELKWEKHTCRHRNNRIAFRLTSSENPKK